MVCNRIFSSFKSRFNHQPKLLFLLSLGVLIVLGSMLMHNTCTTTMNEPSTYGLNTVRMEDVGFPKETITKLDIPLEDLEKRPYQQIKNTLVKLESKDRNIRFVTIHTQNEGEI